VVTTKFFTDRGPIEIDVSEVPESTTLDVRYSPWATRRAVQEELNRAREDRNEGGLLESSNARELHQQYQEILGEAAAAAATTE